MGVMEMKRLILTMSFPIMISMLVQALYNIVDSMFVARVSEAALNAVSICYPVQMIMVAVACGTGVGINALLSRSLGEQKPETAEQVAMHGLFLAACSWIVFALIGLFCAEAFLSLFASDAEIMAMGVSYMQICTICSIGVFAEIAYERIMQSTGNPIYNMIIQGAGAMINIILDPILIFGMFGLPQMGVSGAALATVIGQIAAMFLGGIHHPAKGQGDPGPPAEIPHRSQADRKDVQDRGASHFDAVCHELHDGHDEYDPGLFFRAGRLGLQHLL